MRHTLYKYMQVAVLCMAVAAAGGCTQRELDERPITPPTPTVTDGLLAISLTWPDNRQVDGAEVRLYGSNDSLYLSATCPADGYEGRVPADTYTVLVVNSDYVNATCLGTDAWTECRMKAGVQDSTAGILQPVDQVFTIGTAGVTVSAGDTPTAVTLSPVSRVRKIQFSVNANDMADVAGMDIRLTGIVPSVRLLDGQDAGEATGTGVATALQAGDGTYAADMTVFGWRGENVVTVTLTYTDGSTEDTLAQDISSQLQALPDEGGTVYLALELPGGRQLTLSMTVGAWESGSGSATVI